MTLTLRLVDVAYLDNGAPTEFVLARRGAIIGRSPTCDWSLPDPRNHVSSRHCEIRYEEGAYVLVDASTNGTFLNGASDRMTVPHRLVDGDRIEIGPYQVTAHVHGVSAAARDSASATPGAGIDAAPGWGGWEAHGGAVPSPPPTAPHGWGKVESDDGWGRREKPVAPPPAESPPTDDDGWGAAPGSPARAAGNEGWAARGAKPAPATPIESPWAQPEIVASAPSAWSSAAPDRAPAPKPDDIWGRIADGHVVDWARGGFGNDDLGGHAGMGLGGSRASPPPPPPSSDIASRAAPPLPSATVPQNDGWGSGTGTSAAASASSDWAAPSLPRATSAERAAVPISSADDRGGGSQPPAAPPSSDQVAAITAFLKAASLPLATAGSVPAETMARAGDLLRRLVAGLVVMVEARARAKSQMGAESTSFGFDGNNPLKFARSPEQALEQLLSPTQRGFMDAPAAISDAYQDLQSHQMATLKAMQGALRATLDRFSPSAIRARAEAGGFLSRILPGAREAALWQAYEREFGGVKQGSDEAFMDVFAKEFRKAYEEQARAPRRGN